MISQLFLLLVLFSFGFAYPPQGHRSPLTMEGARGVMENNRGAYRRVSAQKMDLCKSVVAVNTNAATNNRAVHFCQEGNGVCYFTALRRCCNSGQNSPFPPVDGSDTITVGSRTFDVKFNLIGGILAETPTPVDVCFLVVDNTIGVCQTSASCQRTACVPVNEVCIGNIEPDTMCDVDTGCQCQRGYQTPDCCECDAPDFFPNGDTCEELCLRNCQRRGQLGCVQCFPGFTGLGCCQCAGDLVGDNCECPPGQLRGNDDRCFTCPTGQVLNSADQCVCPEGQLEGSNGRCFSCPPEQVLDSSNRCVCPTGQLEGSNGRCFTCPPGQVLDALNRCVCPTGQLQGSNNQCIMCPTGRHILDSFNRCVCPPGELEGSRGQCLSCPAGQVLNSMDQCVCPEGRLRGSRGQCITCPSVQHILNSLDQCVCPDGQTESSSGRCVNCRGDQVLNNFDQCVCPPGEIEFGGACHDPCEENCAANRFDSTFGCSLCEVGYEARPLCCDCTSDRVRSGTRCVCPANRVVNPSNGVCETCPGNREPRDGVCVCPEGTIEQGDNCFNCPTPREVRNGICQCPEGQEEGPNEQCIIPPVCGENQDVIFVQDITQSFTVPNFRSVMHALQFIVGALKTQSSANVNVGLVLYPYIFVLKRIADRDASLEIGLSASCSSAVQSLENLAYSIFNSDHQSEDTRSYQALEFIGNDMINGMHQPTTVITLTDGPSEIYNNAPPTSSQYPINRISAAINKIKQSRPETRFYSAGVEIEESVSDDDLFNEELKALGEGIDSHYRRTNSDITAFTTTVIDLLVDASVLCPNQRTAILTAISGSSFSGYNSCIQTNQFTRAVSSYRNCYPSNTCSLPIPPPAKAASSNDLERRILEAVEEVLHNRN